MRDLRMRLIYERPSVGKSVVTKVELIFA